eukprot:855987-Alexandrium_andersonii.AAC.1
MAPCASATQLQRSEQQRKAEHTVGRSLLAIPSRGRERPANAGGHSARRKLGTNSGWDTRTTFR